MKFKVGDKVLCINDANLMGIIKKGKIYTISHLQASERFPIGIYYKGDKTVVLNTEEFELAEITINPNFKHYVKKETEIK
jgi:hypothetical protein